jgi:DUF4097 and DUF4098 domain-containing protein YvlB
MRSASIAALSTLFLAGAASAETTKTLRAELSADAARPFRVENLAGHMVVRQGAGPRVVVIATVHGENQRTADLMKLQEVRDSKTGHPTLRMIYPLGQTTSFRYDRAGRGSVGFWERMFSGKTNTTYDGERVIVSGGSGLLLYADLVVEVPRGASGTFRNVVGPIDGSNVEGTLKFDSGSGAISLTDVSGTIAADTGSGDVSISGARGTLKCDTGSGDCSVKRFNGDSIDLDTGSGDIEVTDSSAKFAKADTGSGSVSLDLDGAEEVDADTGSGDVTLDLSGSRLVRVKADTGSGDVTVLLPRSAGFEMLADVGSGDIESDFTDAEAIVQRRKVKGYRRGDQRVKINVDTGSGDVTVGPGRS